MKKIHRQESYVFSACVYKFYLRAIHFPCVLIEVCGTMNICAPSRPDNNTLTPVLKGGYEIIVSTRRIYIPPLEVICCRCRMFFSTRIIKRGPFCQDIATISNNIIFPVRPASIALKQIIPIPSVATSRNIVICNKSFYICLRINPLFPILRASLWVRNAIFLSN